MIETRKIAGGSLRWEHRFQVRGSAHFPLDMLRYDHCYPDAQQVAADLSSGEYNNVRTITLVQHTDTQQPQVTHDRWKSFGWPVL